MTVHYNQWKCWLLHLSSEKLSEGLHKSFWLLLRMSAAYWLQRKWEIVADSDCLCVWLHSWSLVDIFQIFNHKLKIFKEILAQKILVKFLKLYVKFGQISLKFPEIFKLVSRLKSKLEYPPVFLVRQTFASSALRAVKEMNWGQQCVRDNWYSFTAPAETTLWHGELFNQTININHEMVIKMVIINIVLTTSVHWAHSVLEHLDQRQ